MNSQKLHSKAFRLSQKNIGPNSSTCKQMTWSFDGTRKEEKACEYLKSCPASCCDGVILFDYLIS